MAQAKGRTQDKTQSPKIGLVLSGGGARAAYQVGVIRAIAEMYPKRSPNPFPVICGTSAGAINSAALAIYGAHFQDAAQRLLRIWRNFHVHQVFRSDAASIAKIGAHWLAAFMLGGLGKRNPVSLLDRRPLRKLLNRYMPCEHIQASLDAGVIEALGISASGYSSGKSVTFYQTNKTIVSWERARRLGCHGRITLDHLMASSAIPFVFAAEKINREYFGDGSMRQTAPLSPALHLGADRVLVVGVTNEHDREQERGSEEDYPSLAQIAGHILNSIFLDSMEADLERLERINKTIAMITSHHLEEHGARLRSIDVLVISPSEDIQEIAMRYVKDMPWTLRLLLRGIGSFKKNGSSLVSYLLFEKAFCRSLISLGYADTMQRREEVMSFMGLDS
ncbi:MAG: patatin-like phospholipase family protein [Gammaproteobacteria bacterium]|nr:MAG: patatin-like phospholipase family protein [Gammaproteobacteria bacterium]